VEGLGNLDAQANVDVRIDGIGRRCGHDQTYKDKVLNKRAKENPQWG